MKARESFRKRMIPVLFPILSDRCRNSVVFFNYCFTDTHLSPARGFSFLLLPYPAAPAAVAHGDVGVVPAEEHLLALGDDPAVRREARVHGGLGPAGADCLYLRYRVRQLQEPLRAGEHVRQEIGPQPEAEDGDVQLVHDVAQLVDLLGREELGLVRYDDVSPARGGIELAYAVRRRDDLRLPHQADAALHDVGAVPVVDAGLYEPDRHAQLLIVELGDERLGGLGAAHGPVFEIELSHLHSPRSHVLEYAPSAYPWPRGCGRPRGRLCPRCAWRAQRTSHAWA